MIFHLEWSLNTSRRTLKQQGDSHTHTTAITFTTNCKRSARTMPMGGEESTLSLFSPSLLSLPSPKDQSEGRNLNKWEFVPFSGIPSLGITETCGPLSGFRKKMCLRGQYLPCSWKTPRVTALAAVRCLGGAKYLPGEEEFIAPSQMLTSLCSLSAATASEKTYPDQQL